MKKIIVAVDSYKGSMSSTEACNTAKEVILEYFPNCECICVPVADGGEGTLEAYETVLGGQRVSLSVNGPDFRPVDAEYLILPSGTAVIEMAIASGLPLVENRKNAGMMTSYGTGELIFDALERGCKHILLGLGGSATNDGGVGVLSALGVRFMDKDGKSIRPCGFDLERLDRIDASDLDKRLESCKITVACDVQNPLCGENGASHIFGPQKGATPEDVLRLDRNLRKFADAIKINCGKDILTLVGGGAAGGIAAGISAYLNTSLCSGIQLLLDTIAFDTLLDGADLVITGEGKIDGQSAGGKVISGISRFTKKHKTPLIAVVGDIGDDYKSIYACGVDAVFSINHLARPFSEVRHRSKADFADTLANILRFYKALKK